MTRGEAVDLIIDAIHSIPSDDALRRRIDSVLETRDREWDALLRAEQGVFSAELENIGALGQRHAQRRARRTVDSSERLRDERRRALGLT